MRTSSNVAVGPVAIAPCTSPEKASNSTSAPFSKGRSERVRDSCSVVIADRAQVSFSVDSLERIRASLSAGSPKFTRASISDVLPGCLRDSPLFRTVRAVSWFWLFVLEISPSAFRLCRHKSAHMPYVSQASRCFSTSFLLRILPVLECDLLQSISLLLLLLLLPHIHASRSVCVHHESHSTLHVLVLRAAHRRMRAALYSECI
jgi:hypothetical protein